MAKKSRRSSSRKMKHTRKHKTHRRRTHRRRGGMAPVNYHLSGSWPSRMSLGQGADYFKYHVGQHGGALGMGSYPDAVLSPGLPAALRGPAHLTGPDNAMAAIKGMCDPPNCPAGATTGGNRRNRTKRNRRNKSYGGKRNKRNTKRNGGNRRNRKNENGMPNSEMTNVMPNSGMTNVMPPMGGRNKNRRNRRRGGALGFAPFPSPGMLLSSPTAYAQAGLNPEWKTAVEFTDAKIRDTQ